jgi:hypothetical protein
MPICAEPALPLGLDTFVERALSSQVLDVYSQGFLCFLDPRVLSDGWL